jgi:hypothetical protein
VIPFVWFDVYVIVGNLEWELLKNVEIRKSKYARITHSIREPPFSRILPISRKITYFLFLKTENCTVY